MVLVELCKSLNQRITQGRAESQRENKGERESDVSIHVICRHRHFIIIIFQTRTCLRSQDSQKANTYEP